MKTKLFFLLFFVFSVTAFAQEYIFGKVSSEFGAELPNVVVFNTRTGEKVVSDKDGNYMIAAKPADEIRFVKRGYERNSERLTDKHFSNPLNQTLAQSPYDIEEIELAFQPTGNLKKDVKALDPPKKVVALNSSLSNYMTSPMTEVQPTLSTPSLFQMRKPGEGQVSLFGIGSGGGGGVVSALAGLIMKKSGPTVTTANYAETQAFYRRVKSTIDFSFYTSQGWTEEDIDSFLIYVDNNYELAKKYRKDFNIGAITLAMKMAYKDYVKTHKVGS